MCYGSIRASGTSAVHRSHGLRAGVFSVDFCEEWCASEWNEASAPDEVKRYVLQIDVGGGVATLEDDFEDPVVVARGRRPLVHRTREVDALFELAAVARGIDREPPSVTGQVDGVLFDTREVRNHAHDIVVLVGVDVTSLPPIVSV